MAHWTNELKIGDKLDVRVAYNMWKQGVIQNIELSQLKIHYEYQGYNDKWFAKTSHKLSPLHTHTVNVIPLSKPTVVCNETSARPLYYKGHIIVTMNNPQTVLRYNKGHILRYNNRNDTYDTINYPKNICFRSHCSAVNQERDKIYIYCNVEKLFLVYDLSRTKWHITKLKDLTDLSQCQMIYVPSPFEQIHLFGTDNQRKARHFVYHLCTQTIVSLHSFNDKYNEYLKQFELIYAPFLHKLMILGGTDRDRFGTSETSDSVWTFSLSQKYNCNNHKNIWDLYPLSLPHKSTDFSSVLAFKHVIFVFYFKSTEKKEILCLDLLQNEWIKCPKLYPLKYAEDGTKTDDDCVHFMYCGPPIINYMPFHLKMSLIHLMPSQLMTSYRRYYRDLTLVYVDNALEKHKRRMIVPSDIKKMIIAYLSVF